MNGNWSSSRNNDANSVAKPRLGQHKRGSRETMAHTNALTSVIQQNELQNGKTCKENKTDSSNGTTTGVINSDNGGFKRILDARALQTVDQNRNIPKLKSKNDLLPSNEGLHSTSVSKKSDIPEISSTLQNLKINPTTLDNGESSDKSSNTDKHDSEKSKVDNDNKADIAEDMTIPDNQELVMDPNYVKHPLKNDWTFWYFKLDRNKAWEDNLMQVADVSTVEDFWRVFNYTEQVSKLSTGCDYAFFRKGINPTWEDKENVSGGRWLVTLSTSHRTGSLDYFWREILMILVGAEIESHDLINGAVANIRNKGDKLSLWLSTSKREDGEKIVDIGKKLKETLGLPPSFRINFENHKDSQNKRGSHSKWEHSV